MTLFRDRTWSPTPQLTATVRLTARAAASLDAWLSAQVHNPRSANEALNMALESLKPRPIEEEILTLREAHHRISVEFAELSDRLGSANEALVALEAAADKKGQAGKAKSDISPVESPQTVVRPAKHKK